MKTERIIYIFNKMEDTVTSEISPVNISLEVLKELFVPFDDDPNFYRPYKLQEEQYTKLLNHIGELADYPLSKYDIYIEAVTL